ncbi:MAG: beta-lactamase-like protein [Podila humilis]|nr:MAG: beta-lactamase-like protein [Podila humilis]
MTAVLSDLEQFIELRPGLFRCTVILQVGPLALPVATFLIRGNPVSDAKDAHEWIMVDAGLPNRTSVVLSAMDKLLCHPGDTLKYLCITHAHLDHTGATMLLLEKYPSMKVISHIEEKPFLCEGKSFRSCVGDTWTFNIMKNLSAASKVQVPEERLLLLREGEEWEYSPLVKVIETHGHTPGTVHMGSAIMSMDKIISLKDQVDTIFPAHDYSQDGVKVSELHHLRTSDPR